MSADGEVARDAFELALERRIADGTWTTPDPDTWVEMLVPPLPEPSAE